MTFTSFFLFFRELYNILTYLLTCLLDDWFFVVQVEPLEEHQVSNVLVARSFNPGANCWLATYTALFVCGLESVRRLQLHSAVSFNWLFLMRKSFNHELFLIFFFQIVFRVSLDPDSDFGWIRIQLIWIRNTAYNNEIILYYFQILLRNSLDQYPDSGVFWIRIWIEMFGWIRILVQLIRIQNTG